MPTKPMSQERMSIRDRAMSTVLRMRPKVRETIERVSAKAGELRRNPAVVGGIAAAAGLGIGLVGRWMRHRAHAPTLLVIETC